MNHNRSRSVRDPRMGRLGFSLIEVLIATILVGLGVVAMMVASGSATRINEANLQLTQAVILVQELREWTLRLPFSDQDPADQGDPPGPDGSDPQDFVDDLDDLMNTTYSPPRNGQGQAISGMTGWSQTITLTWRNPDNISEIVADGSTDIIQVHVSVSYSGKEILTTEWLVTRRES